MKKWTALLLTLCLLAALLTGCGAGSASTAAYDKAAGMAEEVNYAAPMSADSGAMADSGTGNTGELPEGRKWIITVNMSAETEDLDARMEGVKETISALTGYAEGQNSQNGNS